VGENRIDMQRIEQTSDVDRTESKGWSVATWAILALWFALCLLTVNYNGPFFDEGIYVTAGLRTLQGFGRSDGYLGWFAGSLFWPSLAAVGYMAAGLVGMRMVAGALVAIAFAATIQATRSLFGKRTGFWTALALSVNGPLFSLARLGAYDVLALSGIAVSFWGMTELAKKDGRGWLALSAVAFTIGMLAKYPMGLMLLPLAGFLFALRGRKVIFDLGIFGFISVGILIALVAPVRGQIAALVSWQIENRPAFGVTRGMIGLTIFYLSAVPFLLAMGGWFVAKTKRPLATVLLLSLVIWPAYHILSGNPVGPNKHLVFGFLFAYPLVGLALDRAWEKVRGRGLARAAVIIVLVGLFALGFAQVRQGDRAWPDVRQAADYLVHHVEPGERLLINESWPFTMYLYWTGRIDSPWNVFDVYRIEHGEAEITLCEFDWFVDVQGSYEWPESVLETIQGCGSFHQVSSTTTIVTGLGSDLAFVSYPVQITVWENTAER